MLTFPIKGKYFDMIAAGIKPEEYRAMSPYYRSRFKKYAALPEFKIRFRNGYNSNSPLMECTVYLGIGTGNPDRGAVPDKLYFILNIKDVTILQGRK